MKKKALALLLTAAMSLSLLAGCGGGNGESAEGSKEGSAPAESQETPDTQDAESTPAEASGAEESPEVDLGDPIGSLPGSIFCYGYAVEGLGDMVQFFHFYEDNLGIGAVFYAGYAWNQITFSGTYTVAEAPIDYTVNLDRDGNQESGTAPYTITFYDWDGNEIDKAGYDGAYVYNITTNVNCDPMTGGGQYRQSRADAAMLEQYADTFEGEVGIAYQSFINPDDASCTVTLNTNGTYEDMMIFAVEGTWAQTGEGEYTLTPESESDNGAVITLQADGTYNYVSADGTEMVLTTETGPEEGFSFAGKVTVPGTEMEADLILTTYTDGTCVLNASMAGMSIEVDKGTYTVGEDGFTYTFTLEKAGEVVSELGGDTGVQVHYVQTGSEQLGDIDSMLGVVLPE